MSYNDERAQMAEVCQLLYSRGYVSGVEGNVSIRLADNMVLTTPAGTCKGRLKPADFVVTDIEGKPLDATADGGRRPSTELQMHLIAYRKRADVKAVVHAHPVTAVGITVAGLTLEQCLLPEVICTVGNVPTAPYATPSTAEVPESIAKLIETHEALLLDHHGALALGKDIWEAFYKMELIESFAKIAFTAHMLGGAKPLTRSQVSKLLDIRSVYGLSNPLPREKLLSAESCVADK